MTDAPINNKLYCVTPRAGVWIETSQSQKDAFNALSRPVRACGLKPLKGIYMFAGRRHAPCGRVD